MTRFVIQLTGVLRSNNEESTCCHGPTWIAKVNKCVHLEGPDRGFLWIRKHKSSDAVSCLQIIIRGNGGILFSLDRLRWVE